MSWRAKSSWRLCVQVLVFYVATILGSSFEGAGASSRKGRAGTPVGKPLEESALHRRLDEIVGERVTVESRDAAAADERGQLPQVEIGGMRLRHHFIVHKKDPFKIKHVQVHEDFEASSRSRRLQSMQEIPQTKIAFRTPRERVRTLAMMNAAALPVEAYDNASLWFQQANLVYRQGMQAYMNVARDGDEVVVPWRNSTTNVTNRSAEEMTAAKATDAETMIKMREQIREAAGAMWISDTYTGKRTQDCQARSTSDPECMGDVGIAISVYEDQTTKVVIFHGGHDVTDRDYLMYLNRLWILEALPLALKLQWGLTAQQQATVEQTERTADTDFERPIRCAFKDTEYAAVPNVAGDQKVEGVTAAQLAESGMWAIVKVMLRENDLFPLDWFSSNEHKVYLTGSGVGGLFAAMSSMWLSGTDGQKLDTYSIAGVGWECAARRLYGSDMDPNADHTQIYSYAHVMDAYAQSMDRQFGTVCSFGLSTFQGSAAQHYCSGMVGFSGPELFYRGPPIDVLDQNDFSVIGQVPTQEMLMGQMMFDACHYYTHSIWYANMLLQSDDTIHLDGTTDGGCLTVAPVDKADVGQKCPLATLADKECLLLDAKREPLPYQLMGAVACGLGGTIALIGVCVFLALRSVRSDRHLYKEEGVRMAFPCCCFKTRRRAADDTDRALKARLRAKEKRLKEVERALKKQTMGQSKPEWELKAKKQARRMKKAKTAEEAKLEEDSIVVGKNSMS